MSKASQDHSHHNFDGVICKECKRLFDRDEVASFGLLVPGPGDDKYDFICSECNDDDVPMMEHKNKSWLEVGITAIYNMRRQNSKIHNVQKDVCAWVEEHWIQLGLGKSKIQGWKSSLSSKISSRCDIFEKSSDGYGLRLEGPKEHHHLRSSDTRMTSIDEIETKSYKEEVGRRKIKRKLTSNDKQGFLWCHQCKQKHTQVVVCSKSCSKKYCTRCVWRHYREKVEDIEADGWICYYCQGICSCAFCRRRRAKETNTKFESQRGKKRKITDDMIEEKVPKKRKLKASLDVYEEEPVRTRAKSNFKLRGSTDARRRLDQEKRLDQDYSNSFEDSPKSSYASPEAESPHSSLSNSDYHVSSKLRSQHSHINYNELEGTESDTVIKIEEETTRPNVRRLRDRTESRRFSNTSSTTTRSTSLVKDRRITLKDLLDAHILNAGEELTFSQSNQPAKLLHDGHIQWGSTIYPSLSTFAKEVAYKIGAKDSLYNGWRVVYCRGYMMDHYRREYHKYLAKKSEEIEESDGDDRDEDYTEMGEEIEGVENEGEEERIFNREQIVTKQFTQFFGKEESEAESISNEVREPWWIDDEDEYHDPSSILDDFMFGSQTCSITYEEAERDLLVIGQVDQFLDIRDKDFFNISSCDDQIHGSNCGGVGKVKDDVYLNVNSVEEFYAGIDEEYL